jgi:hypothetical protein
VRPALSSFILLFSELKAELRIEVMEMEQKRKERKGEAWRSYKDPSFYNFSPPLT